MPKVRFLTKRRASDQRGFSVVEVLLAAGVFALLVTGLVGAVVYGRASSDSAGDRSQALSLAEEGIEATRNIGDAAYANLAAGTYGLTQTSNQWAFSGASDTSGIYTRQIVIAAAGANRQSITSTVTWPQSGGTTGTVTLTSRMVNWTTATKTWANGILAGHLAVTGAKAGLKTDTVGNYAYTVLNASASNFTITNISTPTAPTNVSTITLSATPTNIFVSGNYAYITTTTASSELLIMDISNPASPTQVGKYSTTGSGGLGVWVVGTTAYVSRGANSGTAEFQILNVSNPASPTLVGSLGRNNALSEVYVSGNYAYLATNSTTTQLVVVNIATPSAPTVAGTLKLGAAATTTLMGYGNTLFVGSGTTLYSVNVATPTAPVQLGTFTAAGTVNDIDVDGAGNAFLGTAGTSAEFQVVNVATPATMTLTKSIDVTGTTSTLSGVAYNTSMDLVVGASILTTQEINIFTKN